MMGYSSRLTVIGRILFWGGILLCILGIFFGRTQPSTWAAPEQHPHAQTIPPRPPTRSASTPTPSVEPSPTLSSNEGEQNDADDDDEADPAASQPAVDNSGVEFPVEPTNAAPAAVEESGRTEPVESQVGQPAEQPAGAEDERSPQLSGAPQKEDDPGEDDLSSALQPANPNRFSEKAGPEPAQQTAPAGSGEATGEGFRPVTQAGLASPGVGSLLWLYALCLGVLATLGGWILVKRASR